MVDSSRGYSLVHPVYLDLPMMLSFLAHVEGGVSLDEETTSKQSGARERLLKGRAGLRLRFGPLAGGDVETDASTQKRDEDSLEVKSSRHHTAASLFNLLYDYLVEDKQLSAVQSPADLGELHVGQLVELSGEYLGNPLEEALAFVESFMPYYLAHKEAQAELVKNQSKRTSGSPKRGNQRQRQPGGSSAADPEQVAVALLAEVAKQAEAQDEKLGMQFLLKMAEDIRSVPVHDILLRTNEGLSAVLTVDSSFYSPSTNEYLRAGAFRVVAKVTRILADDGKINLTRRTIMGATNPKIAQEIMSGLRTEDLHLDVPDPIVEAPAVQVLPMAIFL